MIKTVKISNFKSVQELEIELGRINVFIGENGCGKTSILEGIAMGAAAAANKLDNIYLTARGIRITEQHLLKSAFNNSDRDSEIEVIFSDSEVGSVDCIIDREAGLKGRWKGKVLTITKSVLEKNFGHNSIVSKELFLKNLEDGALPITAIKLGEKTLDTVAFKAQLREYFTNYLGNVREQDDEGGKIKGPYDFSAVDFLIYAPENSHLRRFEDGESISPVGYRGDGLFNHLKDISETEPETFAKIAEHLSLIDWFGGMSIPTDLQFTERRIAITDRFIADTIREFDQRSANEGFLYLLFYFTLFLSKYTPKFFAIDNIDNALNPRLCAKLVEVLAKIAKAEDKQAIFTTHNPAILDGLDLEDDDQRLFVIYRNADGETKARRVKPMKNIPGTQPVRLSEAFVRGYLGGLPVNF